jgi:hypothetical protein
MGTTVVVAFIVTVHLRAVNGLDDVRRVASAVGQNMLFLPRLRSTRILE